MNCTGFDYPDDAPETFTFRVSCFVYDENIGGDLADVEWLPQTGVHYCCLLYTHSPQALMAQLDNDRNVSCYEAQYEDDAPLCDTDVEYDDVPF